MRNEHTHVSNSNGGGPIDSVFDFEVTRIDGQRISLAQYKGKALLIVNTASACGFTPQLAGLQVLHETYETRGLVVLGFPCNQFGRQDPGTNESIGQFCSRNYGVQFPMMAKVDVNGAGASPLFTWLKVQAPGIFGTRAIKWNFTKFLVGRDGGTAGILRYGPRVTPERLARDIEAALAVGTR